MIGRIILILLFTACWQNIFAQQAAVFNKSFDYNSQYENGASIVELNDGYLFFGISAQLFSSEDFRWIIKTNFSGDTIFTKKLTIPGHRNYGGKTKKLNDGNIVIIGSINNSSLSKSFVHLIKLKSNGDTLYTRAFQKHTINSGEDIIETSGGGFAITGWTQNSGEGAFVYLIKTDEIGNKIWEKIYGGSENDLSYSLLQLPDKGFFIVGYTYSYGAGDRDCYLIRTDSLGNKLWQKTYGTSGDEGGGSITKTRDGNYIISGWKQVNYSGIDFNHGYIIKIDSLGNVIWDKTFGESDSKQVFSKIIELFDGSLLIMGGKRNLSTGINKGLITRISSKGDLLWERVYHKGMPTGDNYFYDFKPTSDGGYIVAGTSRDSATFQDAWLLKLDCFGCDGELCNFGDSLCTYEDTSVFVPELRPNNEAFLGQNFPNPFNNYSTINCFIPEQFNDTKLIITDNLGRIVHTAFLTNGENTIVINASVLSLGIYLYGITSEGKILTHKRMVVIR